MPRAILKLKFGPDRLPPAVMGAPRRVLPELGLRSKELDQELAKLYSLFPLAFHDQRRRPLKIGIHRDILSTYPRVWSSRRLRLILHAYTTGLQYLAASKPGAPRLDLEGKEAGEVTPEQAALAAERLALLTARR